VAQSIDEAVKVAGASGWQGYFSDPARASGAYGQAVEAWWIEGFAELIVRAVRGEDMFARPRLPDVIPPPAVAVTGKALANEAAFETSLESWLERRRQR